MFKVNGALNTSGNEANCAEVVFTQDVNASGVVKRPGFNGISLNNTVRLHVV